MWNAIHRTFANHRLSRDPRSSHRNSNDAGFRGAGVPPAISFISTRHKNAGKMPAPRKADGIEWRQIPNPF
jgi:hypothetical protein